MTKQYLFRFTYIQIIGVIGLLVPLVAWGVVPVVKTLITSRGDIAEILAWLSASYVFFLLPWTITNIFLVLAKYLGAVKITKDTIYFRVGISTWQIQRRQIISVSATNYLKKLKTVRVAYMAKDQVTRSAIIPTLLFGRSLYRDLLDTADATSETLTATQPPSRSSVGQIVSWLALGLVVGAAVCFSLALSVFFVFMLFTGG